MGPVGHGGGVDTRPIPAAGRLGETKSGKIKSPWEEDDSLCLASAFWPAGERGLDVWEAPAGPGETQKIGFCWFFFWFCFIYIDY